MRSPLKWIGGKSKLTDNIVGLIPDHAHYGEVFCGAGWLFFKKQPSRFESLNDINSDLICFYRCVQNHLEETCRQFKWLLTSRETFEDFKKQRDVRGLTDIQRAVRFYYCQRMAFGGRVVGQTFGVSPNQAPGINLVRIEEELSAVHLRLARVVIENLSWTDYLDRYDRADTFFYLDPPYWGTEDYYGKDLFPRDDFTRLADQLGQLKGKFILSLNDCGGVRNTFAPFRIQSVKTTYSCARESVNTAGEVLIMNYEPRPGLLGLLVDNG